MAYGLGAANRKNLATAIRYTHQQNLISRAPSVDELFLNTDDEDNDADDDAAGVDVDDCGGRGGGEGEGGGIGARGGVLRSAVALLFFFFGLVEFKALQTAHIAR